MITTGSEISFVSDLPGAATDLEGLAAFDANANGQIDAGDAQWSSFAVWQDQNQDGISQVDELKSLDQLGITSIGLDRHLTGQVSSSDNSISATSTFTYKDGSTGTVGDVELAYQAMHQPAEVSIDATENDSGYLVSQMSQIIRAHVGTPRLRPLLTDNESGAGAIAKESQSLPQAGAEVQSMRIKMVDAMARFLPSVGANLDSLEVANTFAGLDQNLAVAAFDRRIS